MVWGLAWLDCGSLDAGRSQLAVSLMVADAITRELVRLGERPDRAAAEAVLVVEIVNSLPLYRGLGRLIAV